MLQISLKKVIVEAIPFRPFSLEDAGYLIVRTISHQKLVSDTVLLLVFVEHGGVVLGYVRGRHESWCIIASVADAAAGSAEVDHEGSEILEHNNYGGNAKN